jgi:solute carrier family 25 (mitochondrial carnitine/acylcarnitine transporter), member 20/29
MQAGEINSITSCFIKTFQADGLRGFYYGISSPLMSVPFVNAIVFAIYAHGNSLFTIESSFWKGIISGSYAGLLNTLIVTPVELIKIKMQLQSHNVKLGLPIKYNTSIECFVDIIKQEGFKGIFKGGVITCYREIPGYAGQFASFEASKELFKLYLGTENLSYVCVFICGTIGGFNCWFWSYPQDVIKTKIQSGHHVIKGYDGGTMYLVREIWKKEGWHGFWRGFSACSLRATIPNGFGFLANDLAISYMTKYYSE